METIPLAPMGSSIEVQCRIFRQGTCDLGLQSRSIRATEAWDNGLVACHPRWLLADQRSLANYLLEKLELDRGWIGGGGDAFKKSDSDSMSATATFLTSSFVGGDSRLPLTTRRLVKDGYFVTDFRGLEQSNPTNDMEIKSENEEEDAEEQKHQIEVVELEVDDDEEDLYDSE